MHQKHNKFVPRAFSWRRAVILDIRYSRYSDMIFLPGKCESVPSLRTCISAVLFLSSTYLNGFQNLLFQFFLILLWFYIYSGSSARTSREHVFFSTQVLSSRKFSIILFIYNIEKGRNNWGGNKRYHRKVKKKWVEKDKKMHAGYRASSPASTCQSRSQSARFPEIGWISN